MSIEKLIIMSVEISTVSTANNENYNKVSDTNIDIIRKILGSGGKWQFRIIFLVYLVKIPSSWFMACVIFTAPAPWNDEFLCKPLSVANISVSKSQIQLWNGIVHPEVDDYHKRYRDQCQIYENARERWENHSNQYSRNIQKSSDITVPCYNFEFYPEYVTAATNFALVCSRKWLVSLTQSFHLLGIFVGVLVANELLKK